MSQNGIRFLSRWLSPLLLLATLLVAGVARAGTVQIRDEEGLLTPTDRTALQAEGSKYPFDVRILTTGTHSGDLDRYVGEQVTLPNLVVIGIDKEHRRTSVHFGGQTRIAHEEFSTIEHAGNASFKNGDYRAGVEAILDRAQTAVGTAPAVDPGNGRLVTAPTRPASGGFPFGWVILGGLLLVGFLAARRMFSGGSHTTPNPPVGPNYPGYGSGYGPGYGPGGGGGSGLGAGLMGAGLGGLAGYELGKLAGEREGHVREGEMTGSSGDDRPEPSNYDEGGSTGGWDDGGGGGGWDDNSGGGFDSGGGGGDGW
jgi:hypothetical protein